MVAELGVIFGFAHLARWRDRVDSGVRHIDVRTAETLANKVRDRAVVRRVGDVAADRYRSRADRPDCLVECGLAPPGDHHLRALLGKEFRARETNAAVAAGNYGDLSLQTVHNSPPIGRASCRERVCQSV